MKPRLLVGAVLLVTMFVLVAHYMLWSQPGAAVVVEAFPVALIAGLFLLVPRRTWAGVAALSYAAATVLYVVHDREPLVALGWALGHVLGALVTAEVITARGTRRSALLSDQDLTFFIGGSFAGAVTGAVVTAGVALATGVAPWWVALPAVLLPHMASYMVILPHFMARPRFPGVAPFAERVVQWVLTGVCTLVAFSSVMSGPSLAFVVIPLLGWSALRAPMRETLVQLLAVATIAHAMTIQGFGPFATDAGTTTTGAEMLGMALGLFVCACGLTTIPFALAVGVQRRESWQARQEQAKVEQLVQSASSIAIIGVDALGRIDLFNPGAESLLGYTAEEVLGRSPGIFHTPTEVSRLADRLGTGNDFQSLVLTLSAPGHPVVDVEFLRKDGDVRTLQLSISRLFDAAGRVVGFVSTGEDVTRRLQQQLALEEALVTERRAVENLREVDQVKDAFVSGVSHELRTPITSIMGYLEMLDEGDFGPLQAGQAKALGRVKGNSRRLLSLIDDLLTLSRIQDGSLAVATCQLDLRDVVSGAYEEMSAGLQAAGIEFTVAVPDEEVLVVGDEERLGRVLVNLLGNAAKFTDRFGRVEVSLGVEDQVAVVAVSDTGIGIPPVDQGKLFDRFFRSSVAHERAIQGSGLGLSIARAIVETHGGVIEVESGLGVGSTFRVRLPLEGAPSVPLQDAAALAAAEDAGSPDDSDSDYDARSGNVLAS